MYWVYSAPQPVPDRHGVHRRPSAEQRPGRLEDLPVGLAEEVLAIHPGQHISGNLRGNQHGAYDALLGIQRLVRADFRHCHPNTCFSPSPGGVGAGPPGVFGVSSHRRPLIQVEA